MRYLFFILFISALLFSTAACFAEDDDTPEVSIGALFSLSSWGAQGGQAELNGVTLAVEEINSKGGINGSTLSLIIEDNNSALRATAAAFHKLNSIDKVPVIIGPNWSEFIDVVAPLAHANKIPVVTASGYKERQLRPDPWTFVLWPPPAVATKVLTDEIIERKLASVSLLVSENAYYEGLLAAIIQQLEASGVEMDEVMRFGPNASDFRSAITRINRHGSSAVIALLMESGEFASFLKQRLELNLKLPLFAANTLPFDTVVQKNLALANGLVYFDYITAGGEAFAAKYRERFDEEPGFGSAKAYDAMHLIAKALAECASDRTCIRDFLFRTRYQGVSGLIEFNDEGLIKDSTSNTQLFEIIDANITAME